MSLSNVSIKEKLGGGVISDDTYHYYYHDKPLKHTSQSRDVASANFTLHCIPCGTMPNHLSRFKVGDVVYCESVNNGRWCVCQPLVWTDACLDQFNSTDTVETEQTDFNHDETSGEHDLYGYINDDDESTTITAVNTRQQGLLDWHRWWRGEKVSPCRTFVHVPLSVTNKLENPLESYLPLINQLPSRLDITIEIDYRHPIHSVLGVCDFRVLPWHSIRYNFANKRRMMYEVVFAHSGTREWVDAFYGDRSFKDFVEYYWQRRAYVAIYVYDYADFSVPAYRQRTMKKPPFRLNTGVDWQVKKCSESELVLVGPVSTISSQLAILHDQNLQNTFKYRVSRRDDFSSEIIVHKSAELTAWARPSLYFNLILDITLTLLSRFDLGPYVLLEIVDWLPRVILLSHRAKIKYLQQIWDSVLRIREERQHKIKRLCL